mgnify:CR=1 FL=1
MNSIFSDLEASLQEAVDIKNGKIEASKTYIYDVVDVRAIRSSLNVTQQDFADAIGSSIDTVKSWESKRRNPTGMANKILHMLIEKPSLYNELSRY